MVKDHELSARTTHAKACDTLSAARTAIAEYYNACLRAAELADDWARECYWRNRADEARDTLELLR